MKNLRRMTSFILCLILALGNMHIVHADVPGTSMQENVQTMTTSEENTDAIESESSADDETIISGSEDGDVIAADEIGDESNNENEVIEETIPETEEPEEEEPPAIEEEVVIDDEQEEVPDDAEQEEDETESEEESEEEEDLTPAFDQEQTLDGVVIRVTAEEGTFPEDATLYAKSVTDKKEQRLVDEALDEERPDNVNVAETYTFDIKVLDAEGNEIQPVEGKNVKVSFAYEKVESEQLETNIYHIKEEGNTLTAESLDVETEGDIAVVETDGFSYYTVEFTYNGLQYVLEGGGKIKLDDLLKSIDIKGEVKGVSVSAPELFDVILGSEDDVKKITTFNAGENGGVVTRPVNDPEGTVRWVVSYKPFSTEEWMDVVMQGEDEETTTYRIVVTDAIMDSGQVTEDVPGVHQGSNVSNNTFASTIPVADVWIDSSVINMSVESMASATFERGDIMTPGTTNYDPGFIVFDAVQENYKITKGDETDYGGHAGYFGNEFIEYDTTIKALDGEIVTSSKADGSPIYQSYNYFPGVIGTYVWENAAIRMDDNGNEELLDVCIEYSNPMITLETPLNASAASVWNDAYIGLFGANEITLGNKDTSGAYKAKRYGLQMDVKPYVRDKSGNLVDCMFYYPMVDLDVERGSIDAFKTLYGTNPNANNYDETLRNYSEQMRFRNGLVQNTEGEKVFIPGSDGTYKSQISYTESNGEYNVSAGVTSPSDDNSFNSGFLSLIENGQFRLTYMGSAGTSSGINTWILAGSEFNYRLRHTTETLASGANPNPDPDTGGTIQTTREGNHTGKLDDGQIIDPAIVATAEGQTIVYTFYPESGYGIRELWVWNDNITTFSSLSEDPTLQRAYEWQANNYRYRYSKDRYADTDPTAAKAILWSSEHAIYRWDSAENSWAMGVAVTEPPLDAEDGGSNLYGDQEDPEEAKNTIWTKDNYTYEWDASDATWRCFETVTAPAADALDESSTAQWKKYDLKGDFYGNETPSGDATNVFPSTDAMKKGVASRVYEGDGTGNTYRAYDDDGNGTIDRYTYSFDAIDRDNAIHVVWGQTILDIRKQTIGSGSVGDDNVKLNDTFTFRIKAWGDRNGDGNVDTTDPNDYINFSTGSYDPDMNARFTPVDGQIGVYEFTLHTNEVLSVPPELIPVGFWWQVEEVKSRTEDDEYGTTYDDWKPVGSTIRSGKFIRNDETQQANFVNSRKKPVDPENKLIVKKVWENDDASIRPENITITITKPAAVGVTPASFKATMTSLVSIANLTGIKYGSAEQMESASGVKTVAIEKGNGTVYMWKSGNDVYFYSDSEIYLTGSADQMFQNATNMTDISGLAHVHTDFVTSMYQMFEVCKNVRDLSPLAGWNTANVTNMEKMFSAGNNIGPNASTHMTIQSLAPLANWKTQNVTNMRWMFRGTGTGVTDVSVLAGWDVSRVTTFNNMFFRTSVLDTAASLEAWDVGSATDFSSMFGKCQSAITTSDLTSAQLSKLPNWRNAPSNRTGTWATNGTYNNPGATHASTTPTDMNDEAGYWSDNEAVKHEQMVHDVDESDDTGNTWIYEFEVPDDGASWNVYETIPTTYDAYYAVSASYDEDSDGTGTTPEAGMGKSNNPVTGVQARSTTTLINRREVHELKIKKDTDVSTDDVFNFTLRLWAGSGSETFNLTGNEWVYGGDEYATRDAAKEAAIAAVIDNGDGTYSYDGNTYSSREEAEAAAIATITKDDHPKVKDGSFTKVSDGVYTFTLKAPGTEELELPAGVHYTVTESQTTGWYLTASHNTSGVMSSNREATFLNTSAGVLKVVKHWEGDDYNSVVFDTRPTGKASLGITVITEDTTTRWKVNGTPEHVYQAELLNWTAVNRAFEASDIKPQVMAEDGVTPYSVTDARFATLTDAGLIPDGNYVIDKQSLDRYIVIPVENVPFEKTYTGADDAIFLEDDGADGWLYEFNIPPTEKVLSVSEAAVPEYYQKIEEVTDESGETVYMITNTLDTRNLKITKETVDNEDGQFNYGIKFWVEHNTENRHPVKVGHSQLIIDEDGEGNPIYEYEFFFEDGVTINGKDVSGLHERIDDVIYSYPNSGQESDKIVEAEGEAILTALRSITVGETDAEFTRHHSTNLTLADLGLQWNGLNTESIYVEQEAAVVQNMFTNGRRIDWFIIPTPGHDESITVRTPYALRTRAETNPNTGEIYPKQIPAGVTGSDGTYYFSLRAGQSIQFDEIPVGVSYDIVEMKKVGWDLVDEENETGVMANGAVEKWKYKNTEYNSFATVEAAALADITDNGDGTYTYGSVTYNSRQDAELAAKAEIIKVDYEPLVATFVNEREKGSIKIVKETEQDESGTFAFRMQTGRVVDPANVRDQDDNQLAITRIYPEGKTARTETVSAVTSHTDYTEYTTSEGVYRLTDTGVTLNGKAIEIFNLVYPQQFTTMDGMNYKFATAGDEETGSTTTLTVETTTFEFQLSNSTSADPKYALVQNIPYGSRDKIWEMTPAGWKLVSIDGNENLTEVSKTMSSTDMITHTFRNDREKVALTVGKTVAGNQGSRDKYFKYTIQIANAGERLLHLDMSNADRTLSGTGTEAPNAATKYTRNMIMTGTNDGTGNNGNSRDDDAGETYGTADEQARIACEWTDGTYTYRYSETGWRQYDATTGDLVADEEVVVPASATRTFAHGQHIYTAADGTATIVLYLQHGQTATIRDIPFGASYTVTEDNEDYSASVEIEEGGDTRTGEVRASDGKSMLEGSNIISSLPGGNRVNTITDTCLQNDTTVTFTNTRDSIVPTEIFFSWKTWMLLLVAAGAYLALRVRRRRRA